MRENWSKMMSKLPCTPPVWSSGSSEKRSLSGMRATRSLTRSGRGRLALQNGSVVMLCCAIGWAGSHGNLSHGPASAAHPDPTTTMAPAGRPHFSALSAGGGPSVFPGALQAQMPGMMFRGYAIPFN